MKLIELLRERRKRVQHLKNLMKILKENTKKRKINVFKLNVKILNYKDNFVKKANAQKRSMMIRKLLKRNLKLISKKRKLKEKKNTNEFLKKQRNVSEMKNEPNFRN